MDQFFIWFVFLRLIPQFSLIFSNSPPAELPDIFRQVAQFGEAGWFLFEEKVKNFLFPTGDGPPSSAGIVVFFW